MKVWGPSGRRIISAGRLEGPGLQQLNTIATFRFEDYTVYIYTYYTYIYIYHMYICVYVYIYIYMYICLKKINEEITTYIYTYTDQA